MQTILGAGGAIGKELAKELMAYTPQVRLVGRHPQKVNETDQTIAADLNDPSAVSLAVKGSSVVYLVAGLQYKTKVWQQQWPRILQNVIEACREHGARLVFFDNVYAYDPNCIHNMSEGCPVNPSSKKGEVRKKLIEMLELQFSSGALKGMIVRSADFYGPGINNSAMMETVYKNMKKGKRAMWMGDPDAIHNMTYTPDAAKATALLGNTEDAWNQAWHLPTHPQRITGKQWIQLFAAEMHTSAEFTQVGRGMVGFLGLFMPLMRELKEMMYQFEKDYFFNSEKFQKRFPNFRITPPQEGVMQVIAHDVFGT